jgi:hypothetical protein
MVTAPSPMEVSRLAVGDVFTVDLGGYRRIWTVIIQVVQFEVLRLLEGFLGDTGDRRTCSQSSQSDIL